MGTTDWRTAVLFAAALLLCLVPSVPVLLEVLK
ncbi:hypothetical protein SEA_EMOTION_29 [Arthrobacter phage Emotion]|uniref:Uncharacterized protein n=1 Tax=Arthrobacter phage Emotion TaxID=3038361 RepID=A0AA49ERH5_9CAUD|nr:hypothetical protein SEA_EMOTION_29 [Arthrobacter phage Emotion]